MPRQGGRGYSVRRFCPRLAVASSTSWHNNNSLSQHSNPLIGLRKESPQCIRSAPNLARPLAPRNSHHFRRLADTAKLCQLAVPACEFSTCLRSACARARAQCDNPAASFSFRPPSLPSPPSLGQQDARAGSARATRAGGIRPAPLRCPPPPPGPAPLSPLVFARLRAAALVAALMIMIIFLVARRPTAAHQRASGPACCSRFTFAFAFNFNFNSSPLAFLSGRAISADQSAARGALPAPAPSPTGLDANQLASPT